MENEVVKIDENHGLLVEHPEKFLNYIREARSNGQSEKEIAASLGIYVSQLRYVRTACLRRLRDKKEKEESV